jgi:plasmid stabilization system protein ParE
VKYRVRLTDSALVDADGAYQWLAARTIHADAWLNGLEEAVEGLAEMPTRWPLARENREFDEPVHQLLYGKSPHVYRVLFIVRADMVYVLHIRHGARRAMGRNKVIFPPGSTSSF